MTNPDLARIRGAMIEASVFERCVPPQIHFFRHGDGPLDACACGGRLGRAPEVTDADRRAASARLLERRRRRAAGDWSPD